MSIAYGPRKDATKLAIVKGKTFGDFLKDNGLDGQKDLVAQYNWGTKVDAEINRALIELVGCETFDVDPLKTVLDPDRGTGGMICKPEPWTAAALPVAQTHTVKVNKRLPATTAAITKLPAFFDPGTETCPLQYVLAGDDTRGTKKDFEIRATGYYAEVKDEQGYGENVVEKPSGTKTVADVTETRILTKSEAGAPGPVDFTWKGESEATAGILQKPNKVTSTCAPYFVSVRYYKDPEDEKTFIKLKPFYPRWKLTGKSKWDLEENSMEVAWEVQGEDVSKAKLKNGQIHLYDKDGLVFFAPLTKEQIAGGKYNLLTATIHWDKSKVDQKKLPYRVQIQAHSDDEEDNGLALAIMPTQVPAYNYEQVQFIGFNVRNDTIPMGKDYLGHATPNTDIEFRCKAMIQAIQRAYPDVSADRKILKVFVAPEFYFRGKEGAYPVEKISTIVPRLRKETDQYKYLDWLFVFGTALGYQKHEGEGGAAARHGAAYHKVKVVKKDSATQFTAKVWTRPEKGWEFKTKTRSRVITADPGPLPLLKDAKDGSYLLQLTLPNTTGINPDLIGYAIEPVLKILDTEPSGALTTKKIKVKSNLCARIPVERNSNNVVSIAGDFWSVESGGNTGLVEAVEYAGSDDTYILTLSAPGAYKAGEPLVLIEPTSSELFNVALMQKGWHAPHLSDGSLREVVTYKEQMSSIDFMGIDSDTFYDPDGSGRKIRMHYTDDTPLLPTTGSADIGGARPNIVRKPGSAVGSEINKSGLGGGCVIMVDRVTFGMEVCLDHGVHRLFDFYTGTNIVPGDPQVQVHLIPSWGMSIGACNAGKEVTALRNGLVFNVDGSRMESVARVWDTKYSCDDHSTVTAGGTRKCTDAKTGFAAGALLYACPQCDAFFDAPCVTHGTVPCGKDLQLMGTALTPAPAKKVSGSANTTYFKKEGNVQVFPAKPLPEPDVAVAAPVLNSISGGSAKPGFKTTITLKGSGLTDVRAVTSDGYGVAIKSFTGVSDTEVTASIQLGRGADVGSCNVYAGTFNGRSNAMTFQVLAPLPPTLVSITPAEGEIGYMHTVKLIGTNLQSVHTFEYSEPDVATHELKSILDGEIVLQIYVPPTVPPGPFTITLTSAGGAATIDFLVKSRPVPTLISVTPDDLLQGLTYSATLSGTELSLVQNVNITGAGLVITNPKFVDDNTLTLDLKVEDAAAVGSRDVTVTTMSGTTGPVPVNISKPDPPDLLAIIPDRWIQGFLYPVEISGMDLLTLRNLGISGAGAAIKITSVTDSLIKLEVNLHAAATPGTRTITVTTVGGSETIDLEVEARIPPTLHSVTPDAGGRGTSVPITVNAAEVWILKRLDVSGGGITVGITSHTNDEVVATLTIGPGATPGDRALSVTNHGGKSNALKFTVT